MKEQRNSQRYHKQDIKRQKRLIIRSSVILIAAASLFITYRLWNKSSHTQPEASPELEEGIAILKNMEAKEVMAVESEIQAVHNLTAQAEKQTSAAPQERNLNECYAASVIMGDSIAEGISLYGFLSPSNVIAKKGASLIEMEGLLTTAQNLNPQNVFLYVGFNDIGHCKGDLNKFRSKYETFILKLKEALPGARIYANALFPVLDHFITECGYYSEISNCNQIVQELCTQYNLTYLDFTSLAQADSYASDGYHFKKSFYPSWLYGMAEAAGL